MISPLAVSGGEKGAILAEPVGANPPVIDVGERGPQGHKWNSRRRFVFWPCQASAPACDQRVLVPWTSVPPSAHRTLGKGQVGKARRDKGNIDRTETAAGRRLLASAPIRPVNSRFIDVERCNGPAYPIRLGLHLYFDEAHGLGYHVSLLDPVGSLAIYF